MISKQTRFSNITEDTERYEKGKFSLFKKFNSSKIEKV